MKEIYEDITSILPKTEFDRRAFMVTSLAVGFAAAVQPVAAQTMYYHRHQRTRRR